MRLGIDTVPAIDTDRIDPGAILRLAQHAVAQVKALPDDAVMVVAAGIAAHPGAAVAAIAANGIVVIGKSANANPAPGVAAAHPGITAVARSADAGFAGGARSVKGGHVKSPRSL